VTTPAWALKVGAVAITVVTLGGSYQYATTHVKNPLAPLQPPVADRPRPEVEADESAVGSSMPEPTIAPTRPPAVTAPQSTASVRLPGSGRPTVLVTLPPPTPAPRTPTPTLTLAPAVRATKLPAITTTHSS